MKNPVTDKEETPTHNKRHIDREDIPRSLMDMTVEMTDSEGKKVPFTSRTHIVEKVLNVARGGAYEGDEGGDSIRGGADRIGLPRKVRLRSRNVPYFQTVVIELPKHEYVEGIRWQSPPYFWPNETGFRIVRTKKNEESRIR